MRDPYSILLRPLITEKNNILKDNYDRYSFVVDINANKIEIKQAVQDLFNVKVSSVTTIRLKGKPKALGRFRGRRSNWKKAIVRLAPGQKIEMLESI